MKKLASRSAQWPLFASFVFDFNDWVVDSVDGTKKTFGSTVAASVDPTEPALNGPVANTIVFDAIPLPTGAVVIGGEVFVETAFVGPTAATLNVGTAAAATGYASAVNLLAAAGSRTALTLAAAQLLSKGGANTRLTAAYTVANATAGRVRVNIMYVMDGRANEAAIG